MRSGGALRSVSTIGVWQPATKSAIAVKSDFCIGPPIWNARLTLAFYGGSSEVECAESALVTRVAEQGRLRVPEMYRGAGAVVDAYLRRQRIARDAAIAVK